MARRSAKAARKKDAKRQRAAEKRAERARNRALASDTGSPLAAGRRLLLLRDAVVKGEALAPRGLLNLGNTCFFNAVMQNLSRISPFRDYFVGTPPCPGEGPMTSALRAFFIAMWDLNTTSVFDPTSLFLEVGKNNPSFKGRAQQDSHELMRVVFDAIIEEERKRLTNVAKGILPASLDCENSDESSETDTTLATGSDDCSDHQSASDPVVEVGSETEAASDPELTVIPLPAPPADSDTASLASTAIRTETVDESSTKDGSIDDDIPSEKLISIIERTVGGFLSSTIECKECGTKSSVTEPFLDLQLPLVPRDEAEAKARTAETVISKASKAASCLKLRKDAGSKSESEQETKMETEEPEKKSTVPPPPPPPPPPLPALPRRPQPVANASGSVNCDVMRQLRETVIPSEPEPVQENRLIVYTGDTIAPSPPIETEAVFGDDDDDDDDDSEECGFLSSLFEDDLDDITDSAVNDVDNMNAFSTAQAARKETSQPSSSTTPKKTATSPPPARKTSSFISSLFGGLGGVSPAPHGYKSVLGSLEEFTKVEVLEGDNAYGCEECTRREKLRAALQSRRKLGIVAKKSNSSSQSEVHSTGPHLEVDRSSPIDSDEVPTVPEVQNSAMLSSDERIVSEVRAGQGGTQVLMSSPVTSSESSSGVSSEDDGELVIEEELEEPPANTEEVRELTREEEDELIKQFKVEIPGVRTTAEKRLLIREAPSVLTLQLKRFTQIGYRGGLRKISGHVDYPPLLDMTPFVEETTDKSSTILEKNKKLSVAKRKRNSHCDKREKFEYVLTGVVVHGGSLTGGHYTAYVREGVEPDSRGGWYFCNDSKISRASEKDVLNSEAYLLYYERINI